MESHRLAIEHVQGVGAANGIASRIFRILPVDFLTRRKIRSTPWWTNRDRRRRLGQSCMTCPEE